MQPIKIENKTIGEGQPVFIIAEAGVNHNGSLKTALDMVNAAKESGADAIKFQTFKSESIVTVDTPSATYQKKNTDSEETQLEMLRRYELKEDDFKELKRYCMESGIIFLSTAHTDDIIDFLDNLVPAHKTGSGDLTNIPLLRKIAEKKKTMIVGTGMATMDEVRESLNAIHDEGNNDVVLLHCTTSYPCEPSDANLMAIKTMKDELGCLVGYSDHTTSTITPSVAVALGAVVIEKHFTLDNNMPGPDHKASLNPAKLKDMIQNVRLTETLLGKGLKKPCQSELENISFIRKSLVAARDIKKGETIDTNNITIKRPGTGMKPASLYEIDRKKKAKNDIKKDTLIKEEDIE
ncbi:N-acetylneuraminate synthase [Candidatus Woesearchaeota archaeon]|nr:N-acetylneuraminate synthase [Candidatus Woesearchaeota archaeon]